MDRPGPFVRVLRVAAAAAARSDVSSASFAFLFPVLECLLDLPSAIPGCANVFSILSDCLPKGDTPYLHARHSAVIELCFRAVQRPRMEPRPEDVLMRLCGSQLVDTTPLYGEFGLMSDHDDVRGVALRVVNSWLGKCDEVPANAATGAAVWNAWVALAGSDGGLESGEWCTPLLNLLNSGTCAKRERTARGFAEATKIHPSDAKIALSNILRLYEENPAPEVTSQHSGRVQQRVDLAQPLRRAAGVGLYSLGAARVFENDDAVLKSLKFASTVGAVDRDGEVRDLMIKAGIAILDSYATDIPQLLTFLQSEMSPAKAGEDLQSYDYRHEAVVVLLGAAGKYCPADAPEVVESIVASLVEALKTPSEAVQTAVAGCIVPLVQRSKTAESTQRLLQQLLADVLEAETYGERRGAAFGLAAFIKGMGVAVLKQNDVMSHLRENCEKGSVPARQGALGAFERLSAQLGLLFEPYVVTIIPVFAHGVKQVLAPSLRLLGTMAHCAPKQLASCLPQIVPCLVQAGSDTHPRVKEGARLAMEDITTVIRNPEVSNLSPVLLGALADPANKTKAALEALLNCEFMHTIDAPSLALLVPILGRALRDRTADLKRRSAAITGNMVTMVGDSKFLLPYLEHLLPGLKDCLIDPIPDVRATSAKALGSLVGGVGETDELLEIIPWLTLTLTAESSPVERSGAAQGLAELCFALGNERLEGVLDQALPMQNSQSYAAREGLLWLLSFLPGTMHSRYAPHIESTLPVVLEGLCDSVESVREVAMRAGQVIVSTLGRSHTALILPSLRQGVLDEDWRIRHSSVQLVGELLYLIGDAKPVTSSQDNEEEDEDGESGGTTSKVFSNIRAHLGLRMTENILAALYIVRHDLSGACRQSSVQVWKSVVTNTPRIILEIAGDMILQLVQLLASESDDLRVMAGRALGDIVSKLGDRILPTVMPHMSEGLRSEQQAMRQGVCLGLAEILNAISKRQIEDYVSVLVPALQMGFCDASESVRQLASRAFQTLFKSIGAQAIQAVVPGLMKRVNISAATEEEAKDSADAVVGLQGLVSTRPRDMMEFIVPTALKTPMTSQSCYILGNMASAGKSCMQYHCTDLVTRFTEELTDLIPLFDSVKQCARSCMAAMTDEAVNSLLQEITKQVECEDSVEHRRFGCFMMQCFVGGSDANFREYLPLILKGLLTRVAETHIPLLEEVRDAMSALVKSVPAEPLLNQLEFMRNCISSTVSDAKFRSELPLLSLPKALEPFMSVYNHGLVNGSAEKRESCADAMGELFSITAPASMKPYLIKTTGPLIRVVGDRFPSSVKSAILSTLGILLRKGGIALKAFAPQLQTTFVKALSDVSRQTRQRAAAGLGLLAKISPRTDGLLGELGNAVSIAESSAIRTSIYEALSQALSKTSTSPSAGALQKAKVAMVGSFLTEEEEIPRKAACVAAGTLASHMDEESVSNLIAEIIAQAKSSDAAIAGSAISVAAAVAANATLLAEPLRRSLFATITSGLLDTRAPIKLSSCNAVSLLWGPRRCTAPDAVLSSEAVKEFAIRICAVAEDKRNNDEDVRKRAIVSLKDCAKAINFTSGSKDAGIQPLPADVVHHFVTAFCANSKELNPQLVYCATRGLHYLFNWPKGSKFVADVIKATTDTDKVTLLKEFQRKKVFPADDVDSDEEV
eukprot:GSChrysophyteH1.ASY1.ANO1.1838.1 assembled CDS